MSSLYQKFLRKHINLATLGVEQSSDYTTYFCTPKGASIIGRAGIDGIHYCFVRGFGDMVFAVNPSNANPNYVHPMANSFEDFLRLLLSCGSADALEQSWMWDETQFNAYINENPPTEVGQTVLTEIEDKLLLTPLERPWRYMKELQASFDTSKLKYTEDFYDPDMHENAERIPPKWEVYFDGNFWGYQGRKRAGKEVSIGKHFEWAGHHWYIPSAYACSQGLVMDFCMKVDTKAMIAFMERWKLIDENDKSLHFTQEERMQMELENPTTLDFCATLTVNGKTLSQKHGCGVGYNPFDTDCGNDLEGRWTVEHYGLDQNSGWMIWRNAFPWSTKQAPQIKDLAVMMEQHHVAIPGEHFTIEAVGDTVEFIHPQTGTHHTLTVQEYERQEIPKDCFGQKDMDFPTHYHAMSYTIMPELSDREMSISDCADSDSPRKKEPFVPACGISEKYDLLPIASNCAMVIGVIGGACVSTSMVHGNRTSGEKRGACSALHFEQADQVEWRMVFHKKQFENMEIELIVT